MDDLQDGTHWMTSPLEAFLDSLWWVEARPLVTYPRRREAGMLGRVNTRISWQCLMYTLMIHSIQLNSTLLIQFLLFNDLPCMNCPLLGPIEETTTQFPFMVVMHLGINTSTCMLPSMTMPSPIFKKSPNFVLYFGFGTVEWAEAIPFDTIWDYHKNALHLHPTDASLYH